MKIKTIACLSVLMLVGIVGLQKQMGPKCISEVALANINALCDRVGEGVVEYDKACLDEWGDGCAMSSMDWRPHKKPYND